MASQSETDEETERWTRRMPCPVGGNQPAESEEGSSVGPHSPEQRIRAVFGVNAGGAIPQVTELSLRAYCAYLAQRLSFPFVARYWEEVNPLEGVSHIVSVEGLVNPQSRGPNGSSGLLCVARLGTQTVELPLAELELGGGTANARLVEDYWYWFWNWRPDAR